MTLLILPLAMAGKLFLLWLLGVPLALLALVGVVASIYRRQT